MIWPFIKDIIIMGQKSQPATKCSDPYEVEEGCLSLEGTRKAKRYKSIKVQFQNREFQMRIKTYTGWTAQIIQHEIDHCNGIVI